MQILNYCGKHQICTYVGGFDGVLALLKIRPTESAYIFGNRSHCGVAGFSENETCLLLRGEVKLDTFIVIK